MDIRAQQGREHHRAAALHRAQSRQHLDERDRIIRQLRDDGWTYDSIARAIGCSLELVAKVVQGRSRKQAS